MPSKETPARRLARLENIAISHAAVIETHDAKLDALIESARRTDARMAEMQARWLEIAVENRDQYRRTQEQFRRTDERIEKHVRGTEERIGKLVVAIGELIRIQRNGKPE